MSDCYEKALEYVFDVDGHTKAVCTADRGNMGGKGRKICPHYKGKCPAIVGFDHEEKTEDVLRQ